MSLTDNEIHVVAGAGTVAGVGGLACFLLLSGGFGGCGSAGAEPNHDDPLDKMEAIEASIAYKKAPAKQPQKKTRQADPTTKPLGVSRDENKKPDDKKPDDKKPDDKPDPNVKIPDRRPTDEEPVGKPVTDVGEFNDTKRGFAETTKGAPYFRELAADFHENWEFPKILSATGSAAGCLHVLANGTIAKTKVDPRSGDDALDDSIERALKKLETLRNKTPVPVPIELLEQATAQWICFKSNPQQQQHE